MSRTDGGKRFGRKGWVVAALAVTIAAAVCATYVHRWVVSHRISNNESSTIAALRAYLYAQSRFWLGDRYGIGHNVYANQRDGTGFPDLYQVRYGTQDAQPVLGFIDLSFARAGPSGVPKDGYHFADILYADYCIDCGLSAVPARYGVTGRMVYFIDVTGVIMQDDARAYYPDLKHGDPVPHFNAYPQYDGPWLPVGVAPNRMTGDD